MRPLATDFTRLVGCELPIQSVGIPGIAAPERAAAISNAGALAMVAGSGLEAGALAPVPRLPVIAPTRGTHGQVEAMALYAGESVAAVKEITSAAAIVAELVDGASRLPQRHR